MNIEIQIKDFNLYVCIGIDKWEKVIRQELVLNINIRYTICEVDGCMKCKIDYHDLCLSLKMILESKKYDLIEDFVKFILNFLVSEYKNISDCMVSVSKSLATMDMANISCSAGVSVDEDKVRKLLCH